MNFRKIVMSVASAAVALMALPAAAIIQAFVSSYLHRHEVVESFLLEVVDPEELPDPDPDDATPAGTDAGST